MMGPDRVIEGKATLLSLALKNANQTINSDNSKPEEIKAALCPLETFDWDTLVIRRVGSGPLNKFLQNLRNAGYPKNAYTQLKNSILNGLREIEDELPKHWWLWSACIRQYKLSETMTWGNLTHLVRTVQLEFFDTPAILATATKPRVEAWASDPEFYGISLLWQCAKCFTADGNSGPVTPGVDPTTEARKIVTMIKHKTIDSTGYKKRDTELRALLQLPDNFDRLTPMAKTDALYISRASQHLKDEFFENGAKLNMLRAVQGSLRSVASGINNYLRYCTTNNATPFPPSTGTIRRWSTTFNPGKTFCLYTNHVRKAATLLGHDDSWFNSEIQLIAKGLRNAQDRSFAFPNYLMSADVLRVVWHQGTNQTGMIAYLSYLFSLRVPSETLQLTVARHDEKLLQFKPQGPKAIIGPRTYNDTTALVIKFRFRKNIRGGCILIRPCLCAMVSQANRTFCPVHGFWASIRARLTPGELMFPTMSANMFNQRLKRVMCDLNYVDGHRFSSHAFRRGATQEIFNSGSVLATILKSGMWNAAGYKSYLDLHADEAINISALLATALDSDSDDPDLPQDQQETRKRTKAMTKARKIMRVKDKPGPPPVITFAPPGKNKAPSEPSGPSSPSETSSMTS